MRLLTVALNATVSAASFLLVGCQPDAIDSGTKCQVSSPNDSWVSNGITQVVTAPRCPVKLTSLGSIQSWATTLKGPKGISPFGIVDTYFWNAAHELIGHDFGPWEPYSADQDIAQEAGIYGAGTAGARNPPIDDDQADTEFVVSPTFGGGEATAVVLLPYTCCGVSASISQNHSPMHGVATKLRLITNGISTAAQIRWVLDGNQVVPAGLTAQPKRDTLYTATVSIPGVHTWKVSIYEPVIGSTKNITWTQVYR